MAYNLRSAACPRSSEPKASTQQEQRKEESRTPQEKALSNEYILTELFSYLTAEDLVECRLVNKVWNDVATRVFIPNAPVLEFWDFNDGDKRAINQVGGVAAPLNNFMEVMSNSRHNPWRKLRVSSSILRKRSTPQQHLLLVKFFEQVASVVIYLEIGTNSSPMFPKIKPKEGLEYPELKSLKLHVSSTLRSPGLEDHLDAMIGILRHAPKLESISLGFSDYYIVEHVPWTQIQHLTLHKMEDVCFQRMMEITGRRLQLKSFHCKDVELLDYPPHFGENFRMFLERQQDTLETLKLCLSGINPKESGFGLPQLPKLETLEIDVEFKTELNLSPPAFNSPISERFPVLSSISLGREYWIYLENLRIADQPPVGTVKTLKLSHHLVLYQAQLGNTAEQVETRVRGIIRRAAKVFPRVQNLTLPASSKILKVIGLEKEWKDVKRLTLLCGNIGTADAALTGYSEEECQSICEMVPKSLPGMETENNIFQFLQQIQTLGLKRIGGRKVCLTDVGCRLVLLKLENLRCLDLLEHKSDKMSLSKEVIQEIQERFLVLQKKPKN